MTDDPFAAPRSAAPNWATESTQTWAITHHAEKHPSERADHLAAHPRPGVVRGAARVRADHSAAAVAWNPSAAPAGQWPTGQPDVPASLLRADALTPDEHADDDPEGRLAEAGWRLDPRTLREVAARPQELRSLRADLTDRLSRPADDTTRARLLSVRAVACRLLGDLDDALADGNEALASAKLTGQLRQIAVVRARLAHVCQWRGEFAAADRLYALADSTDLPGLLRATVHEQAGRSCYEQGRMIEACQHLDLAVALCPPGSNVLLDRVALALTAIAETARQVGFGPLPRDRAAVLGSAPPPSLTRDEHTGSWGYADEHGRQIVAPTYVQAQPFGDGVAWVQRAGGGCWQLIDRTGVTLTPATYDDVRPFRRGVAAVRQDGWGAIDTAGTVVVPMRYNAFATALTDGRYLDGFTDEGLAVVEAAGWRGVLDRTGRQVVEPRYRAVVIHPLAFLIADTGGRWGALDRRGRPLITPAHADRRAADAVVTRQLRLVAPVL
ncbi:WG repeat-containing protein [Pilimelia columellifera]|uniref:WG repeat-containing protein n=1 Tax=Pilimelia columellifera TaxID=706574 RepID=UPI0031DDA5C8